MSLSLAVVYMLFGCAAGILAGALIVFAMRARAAKETRHNQNATDLPTTIGDTEALIPGSDTATLADRLQEMERMNRLVTMLSTVAARIGSSPDPHQVLTTLGSELRDNGLNCGVVSIGIDAETATILYVSYDAGIMQRIETITGFRVIGHVIPKRFWPGDRILREKAPVWYGNPAEILRMMFPQVSDFVSKIAFRRLGIFSEGQICILPLLVNNEVIGAMPIWGRDLKVGDSAILGVFASQVAGILTGALALEREISRTNELTRTNGMILALSAVAAELSSTAPFEEVVATFGSELEKLGLRCMVGILSDDKQELHPRYSTAGPETVEWFERTTVNRIGSYSIPRRLWPTEQVVVEGVPYWDPNGTTGLLDMFAIVPKSLHNAALGVAGSSPDDPVCYLPLSTHNDVIGVLSVWGASLTPDDMPVLSVFASQLATAILNTQLYENEARRSKELAILLEASQATASASHMGDVLLALASQLLTLSDFESCYITEWDKESNLVSGRIDHSRVLWSEDKRDRYPLAKFPCTRQALSTGVPLVLDGQFEAEEREWMEDLGRTAALILPLAIAGESVALIELASTKTNWRFAQHAVESCRAILAEASDWFVLPVAANERANLFQLEERLTAASGAEVCSISEWDRAGDCVETIAVSADILWQPGQGPTYAPEQYRTWQWVLEHGDSYALARTDDDADEFLGEDMFESLPVESIVVLPLREADQHIGLIELLDFNCRRQVTPAQLALLRAVADMASYSIQNARLLQQTQDRLQEKMELLSEKEVLLKEVHHRVKNNLQVISSLLQLQATQSAEPHVADALHESQNRVRTMALIHEKLYQSKDFSRVDFGKYLHSLVNSLAQTYRGTANRVTVSIQADALSLDIQTAIPCGLIVNELVSNAFKHAFPGGRPGQISITLAGTQQDYVRLQVCDDGVGLSDSLDFERAQSLGLQLVNSLGRQIGASIVASSECGTCVEFEFPQPTGTAAVGTLGGEPARA